MDRDALRYALIVVGRLLALSVGGAFAICVAIWTPTWMVMRFGGYPFLDAYLIGLPIGLMVMAVTGSGVLAYRHKARRP